VKDGVLPLGFRIMVLDGFPVGHALCCFRVELHYFPFRSSGLTCNLKCFCQAFCEILREVYCVEYAWMSQFQCVTACGNTSNFGYLDSRI
jgi:hypothetical protein